MSQKSGRRKLTETAFSGAPRWIARIALPIELKPASSPVMPAAIAALADIWISCGSSPSSLK